MPREQTQVVAHGALGEAQRDLPSGRSGGESRGELSAACPEPLSAPAGGTIARAFAERAAHDVDRRIVQPLVDSDGFKRGIADEPTPCVALAVVATGRRPTRSGSAVSPIPICH